MWRCIFALMIKEFLALLKDKRSRIVLIAPPLVQLVVFGYAATYDLNQVSLAIYDEDGGHAARELLAAFEGSPTFHTVARLHSDREIAPMVDGKDVLAVLHIERNFSKQIAIGRPGTVQVIVDGRNSNTAMIVINYVRTIVTNFNLRWAAAHSGQAPPARLDIRSWFNPNMESRWFFVPGIVGILTQVVSVLITALSVAREREAGTFDQLLVTPLRPVDILLGKSLPALIICVVEASLIILIAVIWFQVPLRGSLPALYLGLLLFLISSIGVGLMISSLSVTQQQGLLGGFLFLVPSIILSGFATPIANMPPLMQDLTLLNPLRYLIVILHTVFLEGASFQLLWPQYWPMAVIGLFNLSLAAWLFRHRMY
jgi:ABC-2 type transport system permease protein